MADITRKSLKGRGAVLIGIIFAFIVVVIGADFL
jgi:hypothetical protein